MQKAVKKKLVSLNVSQIKEIRWNDRIITTGIFKNPVSNKLKVKGVNITGDDQADRSVHGGADKAIYGYPAEHYAYWQKEFPEIKLPYGMFGENLTMQGMVETDIYIGDHIRIGTTELIAVQPRLPCYKLGIRFGINRIIKKFYQTDFPGIYFKIVREGEIQVEDIFEIIEKDRLKVSIKDVYDILRGKATADQFEKAIRTKHLPTSLRNQMQAALDKSKLV